MAKDTKYGGYAILRGGIMKCPKCGSETHRFDDVMYACDKCDWIRHADEVIHTLSARYDIHPSYNGRCLTCDTPYEEGKEEGIKDGYEKGVRDMWEALKANCYSTTMEFEGCCVGFDKDGNCDINNCPIAQKLLKAVK